MRLEFQFAHEAFNPIANLLRDECGAVLMENLEDAMRETAYWDFQLRGTVLTLHYHYMVGTTLFNATPEGKKVLESIRPVLNTADHPILRTVEL